MLVFCVFFSYIMYKKIYFNIVQKKGELLCPKLLQGNVWEDQR